VHPSPDGPNRGTVELHIDTLLGQQQQRGRSRDEEWLTSLLGKLWSHDDLEGHLVVVPHVYVWRLCVDVLVLFHNGSLADVCSRVIRAALLNTKLAHITPLLNDEDSGAKKKDDKVELRVDGDMKNAVEIPFDCPLVVTVLVLDQNLLLVDATLEEEACASCQVKVAIDSTGQVRGVHNQGPLQFALKDDIIAMAIQASKKMFHQETLATVDTEDTTSLLQTQYKFR
jgi:exosome complex RNA-binding protein Rrp42 (RNase PH superfamily)